MLALSPTDLAWEYRLHYRGYSESDCTAAELRAFYALNPQKGKHYLNWGAGGWSQTIPLLRGLGFEVWGYDPYIDHSLSSENDFFINRDEIFLRRFDGIFSNNVIEHAPDPVGFLVDTRNLLRPGGSLAHASPCWEYSFEYTRFHLYFFPGRCREILFNKAGLALAKWLVDWQAKGAPFLCPILKLQSDANKFHSEFIGLHSHANHLAKAVSDKPVALEDTQLDDTHHGTSLREDVFVSYAQNREDVLIWRALGGIPNGIYVDVGAGHPIKDSVTKALYDRGWRGLNIDADPRSVARLKQERLRDRSIHCLVGDGRTGVIWLSDEPLSSSTSESFAGTSAMPLGVATRSLQSLIEENQSFIGDAIHLLKIDVEGDEWSVLKSLDLKAFRPWLIVVEATMPHTQSEAYRSWEPLLSDAYYDFVWFDGLNRYYLAAERMDLREGLSLAPNVFDRYISYDQKISADYFLASVREDDAIHFRRSANRPKLAYCSPMPPDASGIAYYACNVLDDLALRYDITVVTTSGSTTEPGVASKFRVIGFSEFHSTLSEYERIMYHIGNNASFHASMLLLLAHRRATLVLHDTFVGDLLAYFMQQSSPQEPERALSLPDWLNHTDSAQKLAALLFDGYGLGALLVYRRLGLAETFRRFPMLSGMLRHAGSVVVHSGHAESEIRRFGSEQFIDRPRLMRTMLPRVPERSLDGKPRGLADVVSRQLDRRSLGLRESDFLLVSLGYLRPGKCCQELLAGFAAFAREQMAIEGESRASTGQLRLVFVGAYSDLADPWSTSFQASVESLCDEGVQVQVTGWVSDAAYRSWIGAADVAVQLRQDSRGESSGSALDAMAFGLPLVVNRHGSLAELGAARVLSSLDELPGALGRIYRDEAYRLDLSRKSWLWVKVQHSPSMVASAYTRAIEAAARSSDPVGALAIPAQRTLWIDVSVLAKVDSGTGIQRVVRAIANHLIEPMSSAGLRVELVHLHQRLEEPFCIRRALRLSERWLGMTPEALGEESIVLPQAGDIYLLLDLHTDAVSRNEALFAALASRGIRLHAVVYDLLPISNPEWFPNDAARSFIDWAQVVAKHACGLHAISKASAFAVRSLLAPAGKVEWFHLGADIESSLPFEDSDEGLEELDMALKQRSGEPAAPIVLMVSTVEPRKGHMQALDAFEALWRCPPCMAEGQPIATNKPNWSQARLVIVGHLGWCVDHLRDRLEGHPERGRRLFWLSKLSDQSLLQLYRRADLFLMASEGEGFGLPIVEAARHGVPLLLRDLPVFRELADGYAMWFETDKKLSGALVKALDQIAAGSAPRSNDMPLLSWEESAGHLANQLLADVGLKSLDFR
jgi:FkbM family methyltransferase